MKPRKVNFVTHGYAYMIVFVDGNRFFEGDSDELDVAKLQEEITKLEVEEE